MILFQNLPPKKKIGGGETGVGREKGRALQSKLFLKFFLVPIYLSPCLQPDSAEPQPEEVTQQDKRDIYQEPDIYPHHGLRNSQSTVYMVLKAV